MAPHYTWQSALSVFHSFAKRDFSTPTPTHPAPPSSHKLPFLDLPGEIRNKIYGLLLFPSLPDIVIPKITSPADLGAYVLSPPIFRVSRQIRAEALSYLCANKSFTIVGLRSANLFFTTIGNAVKEVTDVRIVLLGALGRMSGDVELFLGLLEKAVGLKVLVFFWIERTHAGERGGVHAELSRGIENFRMRGVRVKHWDARTAT